MLDRCLRVARLTSMKRSTQLAMHDCSELLRLSDLMVPEGATHFFQHLSVRLWVSVRLGL